MCNPVDTRLEISYTVTLSTMCLFVFSFNCAEIFPICHDQFVMTSHEAEMAFMHVTNEVNISHD